MVLAAFALAAVLQAAPTVPAITPPQPRTPSFGRAPVMPGQRSRAACSARIEAAGGQAIARPQPLRRMRAGLLHHTVIRMVDGCPVSTQVRQSGPAR